jgi:membrane protease YdiL (CAAX protease family)
MMPTSNEVVMDDAREIGIGKVAFVLAVALAVPALRGAGLLAAGPASPGFEVAAWLAVLAARPGWRGCGLARPRPGTVPFAILVIALCWAVGMHAANLVALFHPGWVGLLRGRESAADVLCAVVVGPPLEEVVFRGILFGWLRPRLGDVGTLAATSLLFGAAHGDFPRIAFATCMGLGFGLARLAADSAVPGIVLHAAVNALAIILAPESARP